MIQLSGVTKRFGEKVAVDNCTAEIPSGCITGFIGPNGAGKTTTINMITGILKPDEGTITLNGCDIVQDPLEAKSRFALVPDSPDLFLRLSGLEYIQFMAGIYHVDPEVAKERIASLAEEFEMTDALTSKLSTYSHGMRQKTIVIGALVCDPDIWILDEPMTGLDPNASFLLKTKMKEHAAKGKTVFFSTHVLEVAEKLCDKIVMIQSGRIVYDGTLEHLQEQYPDKSLEEIFLEVNSRA